MNMSNFNKLEKLENFQSVKYHFENGHIDLICKRNELKKKLETILRLHKNKFDKEKCFGEKIMKMKYEKK